MNHLHNWMVLITQVNSTPNATHMISWNAIRHDYRAPFSALGRHTTIKTHQRSNLILEFPHEGHLSILSYPKAHSFYPKVIIVQALLLCHKSLIPKAHKEVVIEGEIDAQRFLSKERKEVVIEGENIVPELSPKAHPNGTKARYSSMFIFPTRKSMRQCGIFQRTLGMYLIRLSWGRFVKRERLCLMCSCMSN